ncbi:MAG: EAL domain-containing protein [Alphaproteobacteria bacterium]|nr:EAL domain-containing protein [Alphaproteobacteria bacterium]
MTDRQDSAGAPSGTKDPAVASDAYHAQVAWEGASPTQPKIGRAHIWRSRISWRIALTVFATLIIVQGAMMFFTIQTYRGDILNGLRQIARTAVIAAINDDAGDQKSPISAKQARHMFAGTSVEGFSVYDKGSRLLSSFGQLATLVPSKDPEERVSALRSPNGMHLDLLFTPDDLNQPYYIVARMNASMIDTMTNAQVRQLVTLLLLRACFVTAVLMLILGKWLLEPIMLLQDNLLSAAKNPEKPDLKRLESETRDEVGIAVRIANDLIRQNASNLRRLRSQAEDKIHRLAYYDGLTGLPNRTYFLEKLDDAIRHKVVEEDRHLVVMSVDLDHFKDINDTMGHEFGDKLLEAIGKRLVKALPDDAVISRASADEFTIMAVLRPEYPESEALVDRVFSAVSEPVSILQERFQVRVSIGVSQCPDDGAEARQIMKNADIALNRAKEEGRDTVRYYSQDFDLAVQQRFQLLRDLRAALDQNQLQLYYHPQFDLKTGMLIGAEALLRWWLPDNSRDGGYFVSPAEFIPVAEQSGLIVPIGEWVLRTACAAGREWQEKGLPPFRLAVNLSGVQFHKADIVGLVGEVLQETQMQPHLLELEVTESVFMENMQMAIDTLNLLHRLGVELAIDDFGTGYSSLSYLRQFPIDRLKIDQSFIRNALVNQDDRMITKTIISLGHSLNLKVIAEGVETVEHEDFLKEEGCDEVQGFKYTKPLPADKFEEFVVEHFREHAKKSKLSVVEGANKA